jgi:hypothetical protein
MDTIQDNQSYVEIEEAVADVWRCSTRTSFIS